MGCIPVRGRVDAHGGRLDEGFEELVGARGAARAPVLHPLPPQVSGSPG